MITTGLIDDHELFRTSSKSILTLSSVFSISIEASDGEEFVKKITAGDNIPDVVITDFLIPKFCGTHPDITVISRCYLNPFAKFMGITLSSIETI